MTLEGLDGLTRMIPIEEHDILSSTDITDELADVRAGVHRPNDQNNPIITVFVFHLVNDCQDPGFRGEHILSIGTDPVSSSPSIDGKGLKLTIRVQNSVIRAGPSDPVLELNAEAVVARVFLDCHLSIINDLVQNESVIRVEHFIVIDPPAEITSECLGLATETSSRKASPNCVVERHANLKIVDFPMSVNEHSNLPPESWLRSMFTPWLATKTPCCGFCIIPHIFNLCKYSLVFIFRVKIHVL